MTGEFSDRRLHRRREGAASFDLIGMPPVLDDPLAADMGEQGMLSVEHNKIGAIASA